MVTIVTEDSAVDIKPLPEPLPIRPPIRTDLFADFLFGLGDRVTLAHSSFAQGRVEARILIQVDTQIECKRCYQVSNEAGGDLITVSEDILTATPALTDQEKIQSVMMIVQKLYSNDNIVMQESIDLTKQLLTKLLTTD